jgi:leucyl aminopeptidase
METGINRRPVGEVITDALIVLAWEGEAPKIGVTADEAFASLYSSGEFTGEKATSVLLHRPAGLKAQRVVLAGCGKADEFTAPKLRNVVGAAIRKHRSKGVKRFALLLQKDRQTVDDVSAAVEGATLAAYDPNRYKTDEKKDDVKTESFSIAAPDGAPELSGALERGRILAEAQNFARDLAYEPSNVLTPMELARRAQAMAAEEGLGCEILDRDRMKQLGMGALLGVAQGSAQPPALIVLRYQPEKASGDGHLGLVGKGVTFDTGGISIKPSASMDEMKYDMCGGATMLGAMKAIARLKPSIPVTALIPTVENMPGSRAQRPGDIVKSLSGKTVEVLNTDAEGRLILIDALTYAQRLGCTHLIDAATLTGAIVVALGHVNAGVFSNNDELLDKVLGAAKASGEKMWHMPLDDDYKEQLKSPFADLPNIGTRSGGAVTAAYFLKEFAEPSPWVHLDIAGTAWLDSDKPYMAKGPTGIGVRTLVRLATDWK